MPPEPSYKEEDLFMACIEVSKGLPVAKAAQLYSINRSTLYRHIHLAKKRSDNFRTLLAESDECRLQNWILCCWNAGFTGLRMGVISAATQCKCSERTLYGCTEFDIQWFYDYCQRHPLVCETICHSFHDLDFGKEKSSDWFARIYKYLQKAGQDHVLRQPSRIFHCVQVSFGAVGVILSYSATGMATPPLVVFPSTVAKIPLPKGWASYLRTDQDTKEQMLQYYLQTVLHGYLTQSQAEFPVVICLDRQAEPPDLKLVEICDRLGFLLVNLYECAFENLSNKWNNYLHDWASQNAENEPDYEEFIEILKKALVYNLTKSNIKGAFEESGIFPFDFEDFSYVMKTADSENTSNTSNTESSSIYKDAHWKDQITLNAEEFQDMVGPQLLNDLENYHPFTANSECFSEEFICLHGIYKRFQKCD